jgi:hypothetical protein
MAMQPALFTSEAIAVELNRDRRTVAKALRNVRPDGEVRGRRAWRITTALSALRSRDGAAGGDNSALAEIERLGSELERGFKQVEARPDLTERRKILARIGPGIGALDRAMERAAADCRPAERAMLDQVRESLLRDLVGQFMGLGCWECKELSITLAPDAREAAEAELASEPRT